MQQDETMIDRMIASGRVAEAIALTRAAAMAGAAADQFRLALWHLIGDPVPRDLPVARHWLGRAAQQGHDDALAMAVALQANGSGGPVDWAGARQVVNGSNAPWAQTQRKLLAAMALDTAGAPMVHPVGRPLTNDGRILRFDTFCSPQECEHLAMASAARMEPAHIIDEASGQAVPHPVRTSDGAVISPTIENLVIRAINLRIAAATGTHVAQGEALTILRYRPGQQYRLHHDAFARTANQRSLTFLLYLNDAFAGGETSFPAYDLRVRPRGGDAILFHNLLPDGTADPRMRHAGEPVREGAKWLATRWIRTRPFDMWTGPEAA